MFGDKQSKIEIEIVSGEKHLVGYVRYFREDSDAFVKDAYRLYKGSCTDIANNPDHIIGLAVHEVRHRVQNYHRDKIYAVSESVKKILIRQRIKDPLEQDAYFIQVLATNDYRRHKSLERIANIIKL